MALSVKVADGAAPAEGGYFSYVLTVKKGKEETTVRKSYADFAQFDASACRALRAGAGGSSEFALPFKATPDEEPVCSIGG